MTPLACCIEADSDKCILSWLRLRQIHLQETRSAALVFWLRKRHSSSRSCDSDIDTFSGLPSGPHGWGGSLEELPRECVAPAHVHICVYVCLHAYYVCGSGPGGNSEEISSWMCSTCMCMHVCMFVHTEEASFMDVYMHIYTRMHTCASSVPP